MKKTLMMVTALGLSLSQASAKVDSTTDSGVKPQLITSVGQNTGKSEDALAMKIKELQGQLQPKQQAARSVSQPSAKLPVVKTEDGIHSLISDLESKAFQVTQQNDKLSTYEEDLKTRRLAEKKLEEQRFSAISTMRTNSTPIRNTSGRTQSSQSLTSRAAPVLAARRASRSAHSRSKGLCARYVRTALQAAGYRFTPNASAYQYASRGTLRSAGFVKISNNSRPQIGDVVVINRSRAHPHGHIAIYDGNNWVSDFRQRNKSPYSRHYPYTTWRDARYLNNASSNGLYMANR